MDNFDLKKYLVENEVTVNSKIVNEANSDVDLYRFVGRQILQVGLLTREKYDEIERSEGIYPESILGLYKEDIIKISEEYRDYLVKVKKMVGELKNDPSYKVAVADAGRTRNPLELAYWRATNGTTKV